MRDAFQKEDELLHKKMSAENVERGGSTAVLCLADLSLGSLTVGMSVIQELCLLSNRKMAATKRIE